MVEQIIERVPETTMIILYGSYARDNYVEYDERIEFGIPTVLMSDDIDSFTFTIGLLFKLVKRICE